MSCFDVETSTILLLRVSTEHSPALVLPSDSSGEQAGSPPLHPFHTSSEMRNELIGTSDMKLAGEGPGENTGENANTC